MDWCHETTKMGEQPGTRPAVTRDWSRGIPEWYVAGTDARGRAEGRPYYSRSLRSAQSRKRVPSFVVVAGNSWKIRVKKAPEGVDKTRQG